MDFIESDDYEGRTNYNAPVPPDHQRLLLPGFRHKYIKGPWGWCLSLWLESEAFTFWVQYIHRNFKGKMFAQVDMTIYTLNHLLAGAAFGTLNHSQPVELSPDRSHFFIIPGGFRQEVILDKGLLITMHADFKREYLDRNKEHYAALLPLFKQYDADPSKACHEMSVIHNHLLEHPWRKILEMLPKVSNPVLYLEAQVRELLRLHYERLQFKSAVAPQKDIAAKLSEGQLMAVQQATAIIEEDITVSYSIAIIARKVGLNSQDLKRAFKLVHGFSIHQYLIHLRMNLARELVLSTNKSNNEMAQLCGIKTGAHFARLFRKQYGAPPQEYRRSTGNPPVPLD